MTRGNIIPNPDMDPHKDAIDHIPVDPPEPDPIPAPRTDAVDVVIPRAPRYNRVREFVESPVGIILFTVIIFTIAAIVFGKVMGWIV